MRMGAFPTVMGAAVWTAAWAVGLSILASCASPSPKYQPAEEERSGVSIIADDIGASTSDLPDRGILLLATGESAGRFPAGIAVVRVEAAMRETDGARCLHVAHMPNDRAVYWTHLLDDLPSVRELRTLRTLGLDPRGAEWQDLLRESLNAGCDLCLIYARVEDTELDSEFIGALWDAANRKLLATFRSPVLLTQDEAEKYGHDRPEGHRVCEAEFRAVRKLHRLVRDCVWDLAKSDRPLPTTQPSPWKTDLPLYPRDYFRDRAIENEMRRLLRRRH